MNLDGLGSSQCREDKGLGRIQRIEPCSRFQLLVDSNRPGPTGLLTRLGDKSVQTIQTSLPTLTDRASRLEEHDPVHTHRRERFHRQFKLRSANPTNSQNEGKRRFRIEATISRDLKKPTIGSQNGVPPLPGHSVSNRNDLARSLSQNLEQAIALVPVQPDPTVTVGLLINNEQFHERLVRYQGEREPGSSLSGAPRPFDQ